MRDTERLITEWRQAMAGKFAGRQEILDELEGHLRDEMEQLIHAGMAPQQAAETAMARLGSPAEIAAEFGKVPFPGAPWLPVRLVWIAGIALAVWLVWSLTPKWRAGGTSTLVAVHVAAVMLGYVATLFLGFLAVCFLLTRLFRELNPGQSQSLRRAALWLSGIAVSLTGVGVVLGGFCPFEKQGRFWGLSAHEIGGLGILLWDLVMVCCCLVLYRKPRQVNSLAATMLLGIAGNVVVVLGWFGAALAEQHAYGYSDGPKLVVFAVLAQLVIGCSGFAPAGCLRWTRA